MLVYGKLPNSSKHDCDCTHSQTPVAESSVVCSDDIIDIFIQCDTRGQSLRVWFAMMKLANSFHSALFCPCHKNVGYRANVMEQTFSEQAKNLVMLMDPALLVAV